MSQPHADQESVTPPAVAPVPPPPPPAPLRARNARLVAIIIATVALLYLVYATLPVVVANALAGTYPPVHAVIVGAQEGQRVREGQAITLSARQSAGKHLTYRWSFADGTTATGVMVTRAFTRFAARFPIILTVSDPLSTTAPGGHRAQAQIAISVMPPPPVARFTAMTTALIVGPGAFAVNFDASGSTGEAIANYAWDCGDGTITAGSNPRLTHFYTQTGKFAVTLTVTDAAGQTDTLRQIVVVTGGTT